jgi:hypothetical protein
MQIEIGIPSRDRYAQLAMALWGLTEQTYQDFLVTIIDDSENRQDIRQIPYINQILILLDKQGHKWRLFYGPKKGPHYCHQLVLNESRCPYVWRIDDDTIPDPHCLENLVNAWKEKEGTLSHNEKGEASVVKVGAIGPVVLEPASPKEFEYLPDGYQYFKKFRGKIDEYGACYGDYHWRRHPDNNLQEVDHLQCFLTSLDIAREIGGYDLEYGPPGHREETDFTYRVYLEGYKLYVQPQATLWHLPSPTGGIRANPIEAYEACQKHFHQKFNFKSGKNQDKVIKIFGGLGDHFAATPLFRALKRKGEKVIVSAIYPYVFLANPNVDDLIFVNQEGEYDRVDFHNLYQWGYQHHFKGKIAECLCKAYNEKYDGDIFDYYILPEENEWVVKQLDSFDPFILIAPSSSRPTIQYLDISSTSPSKEPVTWIRNWYKDCWEELVKRIQDELNILSSKLVIRGKNK